MKVLLKHAFFGGGQRFRRSVPASHPVVVPDYLRDQLPSSAVVVDDDYVPPEVKKPEPMAMSEIKVQSVAGELADAQIDAQTDTISKPAPDVWPPKKSGKKEVSNA